MSRRNINPIRLSSSNVLNWSAIGLYEVEQLTHTAARDMRTRYLIFAHGDTDRSLCEYNVLSRGCRVHAYLAQREMDCEINPCDKWINRKVACVDSCCRGEQFIMI